MHYVYLLQSQKDKKFYIGITENLERRKSEHDSGGVDSTSNRRILFLVYFEAYNTKEIAMERERQLKQFGSAYSALLKRLKLKL